MGKREMLKHERRRKEKGRKGRRLRADSLEGVQGIVPKQYNLLGITNSALRGDQM